MIVEQVLTNGTVRTGMEVMVRECPDSHARFQGSTGYVEVIHETAQGFPNAIGVKLYHHAAFGPLYYTPAQLVPIR